MWYVREFYTGLEILSAHMYKKVNMAHSMLALIEVTFEYLENHSTPHL